MVELKKRLSFSLKYKPFYNNFLTSIDVLTTTLQTLFIHEIVLQIFSIRIKIDCFHILFRRFHRITESRISSKTYLTLQREGSERNVNILIANKIIMR